MVPKSSLEQAYLLKGGSGNCRTVWLGMLCSWFIVILLSAGWLMRFQVGIRDPFHPIDFNLYVAPWGLWIRHLVYCFFVHLGENSYPDVAWIMFDHYLSCQIVFWSKEGDTEDVMREQPACSVYWGRALCKVSCDRCGTWSASLSDAGSKSSRRQTPDCSTWKFDIQFQTKSMYLMYMRILDNDTDRRNPSVHEEIY